MVLETIKGMFYLSTELNFDVTEVDGYFDVIKQWWLLRDMPYPDINFLPPTSVLIWYGDLPLCAGFLFKTDANIAIINHVVSNPSIPGIKKWVRSEAINFLLEELIERAKVDGFQLLTASSNVHRLNKRYEDLGFEKSDENETHYGRIL